MIESQPDYFKYWGKVDLNFPGDSKWHPLILHMLDVAAASEAIVEREPEETRKRIAAIFGLEWEHARPWLLIVVACHDLGKACPGFQCKWKNMTELDPGRSPNTRVKHGFVSQIALTEFLSSSGWPEGLAELAADAVGSHHGERISPANLSYLEGDRSSIGKEKWEKARHLLMQALIDTFKPEENPTKKTLNGPDFILLSGLASFADWIGSNEEWFPYGASKDCEDLPSWFKKRIDCAQQALDVIGWSTRVPLSPTPKSFEQVFGFPPRPLQQAMQSALSALHGPAILLLEAPMGEGKTEAAFFAHLELQRRFGHRGLYVALPTRATGNAMFHRTLKFLSHEGLNRMVDLQLLHGATMLSDSFQNLRFSGIHDPVSGGEIRAGEWFTHKKRALLSEYGVGTVDQALLPILPVRHNFVRLWGLANRVVVFDEIHAYDAYTGTLLIHLFRWLLALGSSVVLLSATLPTSIRRKLAELVNSKLSEPEEQYPRLSIFQSNKVKQVHFEADPKRSQTLRLIGIEPDLISMRAALEEHLSNDSMGLALVNTVQRAQDLYRIFPEGALIEREHKRVGKRLPDGTEVFIFHARFPAHWRQSREDSVLENFGPNATRSGRKILIATQVAEQSLDLDFDLIATDLAPIDLVLQRAGRLWRHAENVRSLPKPTLLVAGLSGDKPPTCDDPLWWGAVYREDLLLRTWSLLHNRQKMTLPDEIDTLVQAVYEEKSDIPESLQDWLNKALAEGEGETYAQRIQANQAIIGFPDDASWNDPTRFVLYDEDERGVHRTLMAQTRLGRETVVAIPLWPLDEFSTKTTPDFLKAKNWFMRSINISRKRVVQRLYSIGVPEGWKQSPLLRNCFPLEFDDHGRWIEDIHVRLDDDLGLLYQTREAE